MTFELNVAKEAAAAAGEILAKYRDHRPIQIDRKSSTIDLVTEVDRACEDAIREVFARRTPSIAVLGEERGGAYASTRWVVDPIDGTTNFVHGFPFYAVSIALEVERRGEVAVISAATGEQFTAVRGQGAFCNERPLTVSDTRELGSALLATGFPYRQCEDFEQILAIWRSMLLCSQGVRRPGAASLDLAYTATGAFDGFWEFHLGRWDVAAGALLVTEAGGVVTSCGGAELSDEDVSIIASNGHLHELLLQIICGKK